MAFRSFESRQETNINTRPLPLQSAATLEDQHQFRLSSRFYQLFAINIQGTAPRSPLNILKMYFAKLIAVSMAFVAFGAAAPSSEQGKEKRNVSSGVRNGRRNLFYCSVPT